MLRDIYVRGKYRDVILPMIVRLDAVLDPTKDAVLKARDRPDQAGVANQEAALCQAANEAFYRPSGFGTSPSVHAAGPSRRTSKIAWTTFRPTSRRSWRNSGSATPTLLEAEALGLEQFNAADCSRNRSGSETPKQNP